MKYTLVSITLLSFISFVCKAQFSISPEIGMQYNEIFLSPNKSNSIPFIYKYLDYSHQVKYGLDAGYQLNKRFNGSILLQFNEQKYSTQRDFNSPHLMGFRQKQFSCQIMFNTILNKNFSLSLGGGINRTFNRQIKNNNNWHEYNHFQENKNDLIVSISINYYYKNFFARAQGSTLLTPFDKLEFKDDNGNDLGSQKYYFYGISLSIGCRLEVGKKINP